MGIDLYSCDVCKEAHTGYGGSCLYGCEECFGNRWVCYDCKPDDWEYRTEPEYDGENYLFTLPRCEYCKKADEDTKEVEEVLEILNKSKMKEKLRIVALINKLKKGLKG